ncbi:phage upper tail fiber protein [Rhodococcoides fascians]|uniref:phage upper tail fiber protein n=1 Tax=Rhodococcoides fascians TaxID=1828 RepID=UPI0012D308F5|nr:hypothetical protein [Rhodococcus fascians]
MSLKDDILSLPVEPAEGQAGHRNNHKVLHATAKDHLTRIETLESRSSDQVADSTFGNVHAGLMFLGNELGGKAAYADMVSGLAGKANTSHTHSISNVSGLQTALDTKPTLVGGKLPTSYLNRVEIGETLTAANQSAMLALDAQPGDIAVRSDNNSIWMLKVAPATSNSSWFDITANVASGGVASVNGQVGTVVLGASDVGAAPTGRTITAGTGLTGGGDLSANRTVTLSTGSQASLVKADSAVQGFVNGTSTGTKIERMTAAQYAALGTKDANTIYLVTA